MRLDGSEGAAAVRRVEAVEEQRVLDVDPRAAVAVVVVAPTVEHVRLQLVAGERGAQQIVGDIAHVSAAAVVRGGDGDGIEGVHQLVDGDDRAKRAPVCAAGLEEHDRDPRQPTGRGVAHAADLEIGRLLLDRPVVVDEVCLLGLDEPVLGEQEADRRERGVDLPGRLRQRHVGDVKLSERARAGERVEIETRRARRVLQAPPRVDRGGVTDDARCPSARRSAPPGGRTYATWTEKPGVASGRRSASVDPIPHHGTGVDASAGAAEPNAATTASPTRSRFT